MDLPKILRTGLFFLFFFGFPRVFGQLGLGQQKPREKPNKPKKTILNGLTQDSSHRIVFFVFFGFPRVFGQLGLGQQKPREKPKKKQSWMNLPKIILTGLFFCVFWFIWFSLSFWTYGKVEMKKGKKDEKTKDAKTQRSQRPFLIQKTHTTKGKHIQKAWKHTKRHKVESTCHLHKYTSENRRKKQPHVHTYPKNTQQRENTSKRHENTLKGTKLRAHVICTNTRRKIAEKNNHTCTHIQKTHTTKGKHIQKAWKHTKRHKVESTCHLHKYTSENRRKKQPHVHTYPKNTQQRENTSKRHENTLKGTKLSAHVICTNTRRKIAEKTTTRAHISKNTHNKGKTHPKGMKTHWKAQSWEHMSSAQIHVGKSQKKNQPHVHTYPKNTHNKGKTHPKGMKTHGFRPVSDLFGVSMFSVLPSISTTKYYSGTRAYIVI